MLGGLALLVLYAGQLRADVIRVGYAEAEAGDRGVQVIITAANDAAIHGYSIALTYPTPELSLQRISVAGTHAGVYDPEFVASRLDNQLGVGTLGVLFDFNEPFSANAFPELPADEPERIVARLTFNVSSIAAGGVYPLRLVDGIGTPAAYNRFTIEGEDIRPVLRDGTFVISGGNRLMLDSRQAIPGATPNLIVFARAQHAQPLGGFQIAFTYDKRALDLNHTDLDAEDEFAQRFLGTSTLLELGANRIENYVFTHDEDFSPTHARAAAAVLFDFFAPLDTSQVLPPSLADLPEQTLMRYTFVVKNGADAEKQYQDLTLSDLRRPGFIDNRFFVGTRGFDVELTHGRIYFSRGELRGRVVDNESLEGVPNAFVSTDPGNLLATTDGAGRFVFEGIPPGPYRLKLAREGYYTVIREGIEVRGRSQVDDIGDTAVYAIPFTPPKPFLRGHINSDTTIDLSDGIGILNFLFLSAGGMTCLLAADVNDDENVDLSDGVYLLNYLFVGGPAPAPPYSSDRAGCGSDPTPTEKLTCEEFECRE